MAEASSDEQNVSTREPAEGPREAALRLVKGSPFNAETGEAALAHELTPNNAHFVRCHFGIPEVSESRHRLELGGAVGRSLTLSVAELRAMGSRSIRVTLECAGNGRFHLRPLPKGEPWCDAAVGTALWTGVPLRRLLERAGLRDDVCEVLAVGADQGSPEPGEVSQPFARSLPMDKALDGDTLVAFEMNGQPVPGAHGGPLRLVVPGWYGVASVKWLARLEALVRPFDGYYQSKRYLRVDANGVPGERLARMVVKSLVVSPTSEGTVEAGALRVRGWAWSGAAAIVQVQVCLDDGPWQAAALSNAVGPWAWRGFSIAVDVKGTGRHTLRSRAVDAAGRSQPDEPEWNRYGYGHNAVVPVLFNVD